MTLLERVRHDLAAHRAAGDAFEAAWPAAITAALASVNTSWNRESWQEAFESTADAWRRAYDGQPSSLSERPLCAVRRFLEIEADDAELGFAALVA